MYPILHFVLPLLVHAIRILPGAVALGSECFAAVVRRSSIVFLPIDCLLSNRLASSALARSPAAPTLFAAR
jgi:hypothetical protein